MMKRFIFIALLCLLLTGCGETETKGYVVGKRHTEAHTRLRHNPLRRVHYPEKWEVWVADSVWVRSVEVSETTYGRLHHGQFVRLKR